MEKSCSLLENRDSRSLTEEVNVYPVLGMSGEIVPNRQQGLLSLFPGAFVEIRIRHPACSRVDAFDSRTSF